MIKFTNSLDGLKRTSGLVAASSDYTCMLLFSPAGQTSATGSEKTVFFARNSADPTQYIHIGRSQAVNFGQTGFKIDVGSSSAAPSTGFQYGSPHAVWYVRSGNDHKLYIEGALHQTITVDITGWTLDEVWTATRPSGLGFPGGSAIISVGAFREWDVALTPAQLRAEMNAAAAVVTSGLTCDTPLLADLLDDSGNGSDWALNSGAGTFALHAILDPTIASQDLVHTIAEHNAIKEIIYAFAATVTGYVAFTLSQSGADKPRLDMNPPGGVPGASNANRLAYRVNTVSGWFKAVAGSVYAIRLSNSNANVSADFTWHLEVAPTLDPTSLPQNAHIINDDSSLFPATVYTEDGVFLGFAETIPSSEIGAALPNGYTLWHDRFQFHGNYLALIDPDLALVSSFNLPGGDAISFSWPRLTSANGVFYVLNPDTGAIYTITTAGVATKIATITGYSSSEMAHTAIGVNVGATILYFTLGEEEGAIKRWDLNADVALADLYTIPGFSAGNDAVAKTPNGHPGDIIVQSDGSVVTWWVDDSLWENTLIHVSEAGALLLAETFDMDAGAIDHLAPGDSATQVRIWQFEDSLLSQGKYFQPTLSAGLPGPVTLQTSHNGLGQNFISGLLTDLFAPSESCTFVIYSTSEASVTGVIGPLAWVHWPRRIPGSPSITITDTYSDMDMQCPEDWENGFKEGLVTRWGDAERPSSHLFTGEWQGSTFTFQIADKQARFRAQQASFVDRFWNDALTVRMTTRENRANRGIPYTVFSGPIIDAQPTPGLLWDITLGDAVSQGLLSDRAQVPWRQHKDGFLSTLTEISENLDREGAEPIIYGTFDREPGDITSPGTNTGLRLKPIYLGIENVPVYGDCHAWLVCGHAVKDVQIFVDDVYRFETVIFNHWLIPHQSEFQSQFGAPYRDIASDTYGNLRRYTIVYGQVGTSEPDDCATGVKTLTVSVSGVESAGDGSGTLITDRYEQYKHFLINFVANSGPQSYQSGAWLTNPVWDIFDGPVEKVDEDSFDDAAAIANTRILNGYIGAAAIGMDGDRASVKTWIATWNRSCACRFGITHAGQMFIYLLSPTDAIKAAAVLYTDAYEILEETFSTEFRWDEQATTIPFQTDYDMQSGQYQTNGAVQDPQAITDYGRDIPSEVRSYDFAPGADQAEHLATLELRIRTHAPRYVRLEGTIGHDPVTGDSLAYRDIGDYIRYVSFDAVQETREERLAQVVTPIVRVGSRKVGCVAMDCEDLIGYDLEGSPGGSWGGSP